MYYIEPVLHKVAEDHSLWQAGSNWQCGYREIKVQYSTCWKGIELILRHFWA